MPHPYRGREFIHMAKLKTANDKVKFMDGGFFTLVLTFLIIFYSRIVDSEFCCMFTPSQRSETKNTTIMKNAKTIWQVFKNGILIEECLTLERAERTKFHLEMMKFSVTIKTRQN